MKYIVFSIVIVIFLFLFSHSNLGLFKSREYASTRLFFVGDIMLSRGIEKIVYREQDPLFHFLRTAELTQNADIAFGNLEGPASMRGSDQGSIYSFRSKPDLLKGLAFAGFDVVSIANNHIYDWGPLAVQDTIIYLKENSILPVGGGENYKEAHSPAVIERNNERFCFLAYSQFAWDEISNASSTPSIAKLDLKTIEDDIKESKNSSCSLIIVSLHWGNEYETASTEEQKQIAHGIIDAGAKLLIGHHPHSVQEVEEYHGGLIAYSLGNFIFDQNFSPETKSGLALSVEISNGKISDFQKLNLNFTHDFQPYVAQ